MCLAPYYCRLPNLLTCSPFIIIIGYLSLSQNEFEGSLPTEIVELTSLSLLFVDGNNFEGTIPSGIEKMKELGMFNKQYFDVWPFSDTDSIAFLVLFDSGL